MNGVDIGAGLMRLVLLCKKADKEIAATAGISSDQMHCLFVLHSESPACIKGLSGLLGWSPTRTSKILRALEEGGYVRRRMDEIDRRKEQVALTEKGIQTAASILSVSGRVGESLSGRISELVYSSIPGPSRPQP